MSKKRRRKVERFVAGYADGSGKEYIRDRANCGKAVATTAWGCSCCKPEVTAEHERLARDIASAMNEKERAQ